MWGSPGDTTQDGIQKNFMIVIILCIPTMLLPKPLYEIYCHKKSYKKIGDDEGNQLLSS